jgi:mannose-1-phosphate guanylyltransferase
MRAFVLAAGLGTRLRPLTEQIPKCLVPIGGRPLLAYWFDLFSAHGVDHLLLNTHHLHEQVVKFIESFRTPIQVTLVYEPTLLGSAGTLRANQAFVKDAREFFVVYADNLTNADLTALLQAHRRLGQVATLGLFRTPVPNECGIVVLDERGTIISFQEKPERPLSDLAFAGVMVASPEIFDVIPNQVPCDLGKDVFGRLVGRMSGWELNAYLRDIGTPESYEQAQSEVKSLWTATS